jgi:predicted NACHT family NTPase
MFIELKVFARKARKQDDFSLLKYVKKELCICEISEPQIEKMLHQGRFLILLDGLDEVKADDGEKVLTEVYDFSREYFKNQFVITCRIAALLANQRYKLGFTDVEVADFTSKQIEEFAQKWFVAVARNSQKKGLATANQFIEKLNLPENEQIRELAVTPILLNLTCLVFQGRRNFPSKRSKLYEQGLEISLKRWDESRGIKRDEVYRNLSLPQKIHLLSHVAAISFEQGNTFLKKVKSSNLLPTISVPYLWLQLTRINCRWIVK